MYGPPCDEHLHNPKNIFNENAKFTIIEKKIMHLSPNTEKIFGHLD